jgi:hypothetical protein
LLGNTTATWEAFKIKFKDYWSKRKDECFLLAELTGPRKWENETVREFNQRFGKSYKMLPAPVRLNEALTLVIYSSAFGADFNYMLREKSPTDLNSVYSLACFLERNLVAYGKSTTFDFR